MNRPIRRFTIDEFRDAFPTNFLMFAWKEGYSKPRLTHIIDKYYLTKLFKCSGKIISKVIHTQFLHAFKCRDGINLNHQYDFSYVESSDKEFYFKGTFAEDILEVSSLSKVSELHKSKVVNTFFIRKIEFFQTVVKNGKDFWFVTFTHDVVVYSRQLSARQFNHFIPMMIKLEREFYQIIEGLNFYFGVQDYLRALAGKNISFEEMIPLLTHVDYTLSSGAARATYKHFQKYVLEEDLNLLTFFITFARIRASHLDSRTTAVFSCTCGKLRLFSEILFLALRNEV